MLKEKGKAAYTQDSSRFKGRMPLTIPRDDASNFRFVGSCSQGSCTVGGGNCGTGSLQKKNVISYETPLPSSSSAFDSSIPSHNMISNSSHPTFDHIALKSDFKSSSSTLDSCWPSVSNFEGGCPNMDDVIVVSSMHSKGLCSAWLVPEFTNEILCCGRSEARLRGVT